MIVNVSYAENLLYTDLQKICEFNKDTIPENKEQIKTKKLACFYYIKGYLEVANHNCMFDLSSNNLHKLNTTKINFEQIFKSSINPAFDYKALTVGIPTIQSGNYSLVPKLDLKKINKNSFGNYLLRVSFDISPLILKEHLPLL